MSLQNPSAVVLILGGLVSCLAGYRLFRVVLGIYGFILGAMLASSVMGISHTLGMIVAAVIGGLIGATILVFAYFIGVALVGAGLGALMAHLLWRLWQGGDDPHPAAIVLLSVAGALGAMWLQRYVIILGTAFAGAWMVLAGVLVGADGRAATAADAIGGVWIFYPLDLVAGRSWVPLAWIALGGVGTVVQLMVTGKRR